jgi:hypothetical protein
MRLYDGYDFNEDEAEGKVRKLKDGPGLDQVVDALGGQALNKVGTDYSGSHGYWCPTDIVLSKEFADAVYGRSMIARRAVELLPKRSLRLFKGWESETKLKDSDKAILKNMYRDFRKHILRPLFDACALGRLHGDAYLVLFWDDTDDLSKPFDPSSASGLVGSTAKSCHYMYPQEGKAPGTADYYHLTVNTHAMSEAEREQLEKKGNKYYRRVHKSRVWHVPGIISPLDVRADRQGQNFSIIEYIDEPLREWQQGKYSAIDMLKSHSLFKLAMNNVAIKSITGGIKDLIMRFKSILKGMKFLGSIVLDRNQEEAEFINRSYSGVDKLIMAIDSLLTTSADIPSAFLLNDGTAFQSGDANTGARYELATLIEDYIDSHLHDLLERYKEAWFAVNSPGKLNMMESLTPNFRNALMQTRHEMAEVEFKFSQADVAYVGSNILNPETIRTRWEDGTYNDHITLTGKLLSTKELWEQEKSSGQSSGPNTEELARNAATAERGRYTTPGAKKKKDQKQSRKTNAGQKRGAGQKMPN